MTALLTQQPLRRAEPIAAAAPRPKPTLWGLSPVQLHDRFWAASGVQVVRQGEKSEIVSGAELFLLTEPRTLTLFRLARPVEVLSWIKPDVLIVRLHDDREHGYIERVVTTQENRFVRFERVYRGSDSRLARVALTPDKRIAELWQSAASPRAGWLAIRRGIARNFRGVLSVPGRAFDRADDCEVMQFVRELVPLWRQPSTTISRASHGRRGIWADQEAVIDPKAAVIGPVWIGAGRRLEVAGAIVGPTVLWDDPASRPPAENVSWQDLEPVRNAPQDPQPRQRTSLARAAKRLFDIGFALFALLLTLPLYPLIMLAIWVEDGWPFFFVQRRETKGGREFGCIKFRSMRKDAEKIKAMLMKQNQADGPQFYVENDPRSTRVGRFLRSSSLDELPQFLNVLLGHMSVVGPRPSPFRENQYCPAWREARLSVRPGITGLWQVRRTRQLGQDFQEWIKYDLEYVENISWLLDLRIICDTIRTIVRGILRA